MKLLLLLTLLVSLAVALETTGLLEERQGGRARKRTSRPKKATSEARMAAARRPSGAPAKYRTSVGAPSRKRAKGNLKKLPAELIDADNMAKRAEFIERRDVLVQLKRQSTARDFYECQNANPAPSDADCQVIVDQVYNTGQTLVIQANACAVFSYESCEGFFCSLCQTLQTTTDFIGNQLSSAESLCVAKGQVGTIVGEDPPQWDAGFVYAGDSLPTYDVC